MRTPEQTYSRLYIAIFCDIVGMLLGLSVQLLGGNDLVVVVARGYGM
jgi:hypothetical protein